MTYISDTFLRLMAWHETHLNSEEGQGLTEYGLILALIAVMCVAALTTLQGGITGTLESIAGNLGG
jgi:pilus assembly protein Flp/PilA